jgi:hydroxypyruvate reductase
MTPRDLLESIYREAVRAADPERAAYDAVAALDPGAGPWVIAIGKAGRRMARGTLRALMDARTEPKGGLVLTVSGEDLPLPPLDVLAGDHPLPGARSEHAAEALSSLVERVKEGDRVLVLVSGGASSLIAAPIPGLSSEVLRALFTVLLGSGAPIHTVNGFRRRVLRWGGGRLALALGHTRLHAIVLSDVLGDQLAAIGSGPCTGDPSTAAELLDLAWQLGIATSLPAEVMGYLASVNGGGSSETPKPGAPELEHVRSLIIGNNRLAVNAAAGAAHLAGVADVVVPEEEVTDEARVAGEGFARRLIALSGTRGDHSTCVILGGEPTVDLRNSAPGRGGRCQEFALSAAFELSRSGPNSPAITLLAAGTDGRDGPDDAAGAIVDRSTWSAALKAGRDPRLDLESHDTYLALDAAGALLRTGPSGTNVNDLFIGLIGG